MSIKKKFLGRSIKAVHTNLFPNITSCINLNYHWEFFEKRLFQTYIIVKRTCASIFIKIWLVDQSKPCTQKFCKNHKLHKFATCNYDF